MDFIQAAGKHIQDQRVWAALQSFAATLLITVATGAGAAWLGTTARAAIAGEAASMVRTGFAITADVLTNVTINTAVQRAMSDGDTSLGWMVLENLLMEGFTRNLLGPLRKAEETAKNVARQYAHLPNLTAAERQMLLSLNLEARGLMGEFVGGMAAQWAAHQIVTRVRKSLAGDEERERLEENEVSEAFAMTVLQQGAAIGLGKFFGGKIHAWNESRKVLEASRLGSLPELRAYLDAREAFYRQAEALGNNPSPDPSEEQRLVALDAALALQEEALLAAHGGDHDATRDSRSAASPPGERARETIAPTSAEERAPGPAPVVSRALGTEIAGTVPGVRYESGGSFKIATPKGDITVRIRRGADQPRIVHEGPEVILEIPRGLDDAALRATVARQLDEVRGLADATRTEPAEVMQQLAEEDAPGRLEVTAAAVPGSSFQGKGEHPVDPETILTAGDRALDEIVNARADVGQPAEHAHVDPAARPDLREIAEHTHVIQLRDGQAITIRVAVAPLEHQNVARSVMNPTKEGRTKVDRAGSGEHAVVTEVDVHGRYVIQLSDKMAPGNVRRAIAHEVAEILARRALGGRVPGLDMLRPGSDVTGPLSPHDHGRIAEINELARELHVPADADAGTADRTEHVNHELMALVEDMGLRKGTPGAEERYERMKPELTAEARDALDAARANEATLSEANAKRLAWTRDDAARDRASQQAWDHAHIPPHEVPSSKVRGRIATEAERKALAASAKQKRAARSAATLAWLRAEASTGRRPKMRVQLGGGASLAARDPSALFIDANQRWAVDASPEIAQTAQQLEGLKAAGIGDPYEFAAPTDRVPMEAIRFWQDEIAAQGPVVDARGELGVDADGTMIVTIHPESGPPIVVEVEGIPVVATGFAKELAPGAPRNKTPRQALVEIEQALSRLEQDPTIGSTATEAGLKLKAIQGTSEGEAARALAELPADVRARLDADTELKPALAQLDAQQRFENLRKGDPGHVLYGDEANRLEPEQVRSMSRVVIAGTGGTGISAAENILIANPSAHVMMVGKDPPAGLLENDQFRKVVARYGTDRLRAELRIAAEGSDGGRFDLQDGYLLGAPTPAPGGGYDAAPAPIPGNTKGLPAETFQGDTYIAALGRADDLPPPVAALANEAQRANRKVVKKALRDADELYVGYRIKIEQPNGTWMDVDVTGAASRFADKSKMSDKDQKRVANASDHDAPPESGNFDGGYVSSATQALRYASATRAGEIVHEGETLTMAGQ